MATVGGVLNMLGVAVAAVGLWQTWRDFGNPAESFWHPLTAAAAGVWRACVVWARRILRRPQSVTVTGHAASSWGFAGNATVRLSWGPLPDPATDMAGFAAAVHDRLQNLHEALQAAGERVAAESEARAAADDETRTTMAAEVAAVRTYAQNVALDGVRLEALGLGLIAVGTALSLLG